MILRVFLWMRWSSGCKGKSLRESQEALWSQSHIENVERVLRGVAENRKHTHESITNFSSLKISTFNFQLSSWVHLFFLFLISLSLNLKHYFERQIDQNILREQTQYWEGTTHNLYSSIHNPKSPSSKAHTQNQQQILIKKRKKRVFFCGDKIVFLMICVWLVCCLKWSFLSTLVDSIFM